MENDAIKGENFVKHSLFSHLTPSFSLGCGISYRKTFRESIFSKQSSFCHYIGSRSDLNCNTILKCNQSTKRCLLNALIDFDYI